MSGRDEDGSKYIASQLETMEFWEPDDFEDFYRRDVPILLDELTAAAKRVEEVEGQLAALKAGCKQIQERFDEARDNILHCRYGLAEELDGRPDVVNAILGIIDDLGEVITTTNRENER
jgi:hypothetical protein